MTARVLTFGTFDHLHPGHLAYLREAATFGPLFVVVARDANVERIKGRAPVQDEQTRMRAVQDAFPDATVMLGDGEDFLAPVRSVKPTLVVLGYDQRLPPGVTEELLGCAVHRAAAFQPEVHKSSLHRGHT